MLLDPEITDLKRLKDEEFETLILRLTESEVVDHGGIITDVSGSGHINAPDEGIDVWVQVPNKKFQSEFIPTPITRIQVKNSEFEIFKIEDEMCPDETLRNSIKELSTNQGTYILVSASNLGKIQRSKRLRKMQEIIGKFGLGDTINLKFYDLSIIHQWLRQHPVAMNWVKPIIGMDTNGWQNYGNWSSPCPDGPLIEDLGTIIEIPSRPRTKFSLINGINEVREIIRNSDRTFRVIGISGVGKTRIVQALFEESVGNNPLDRNKVLYFNVGDNPISSIQPMVERLLVNEKSPIIVLDNCSISTHNEFANQLSAKKSKIKLITVEYDIRENLINQTDVIHISTKEPDIATNLVKRHYNKISFDDAIRIGKFAEGNLKLSLAVAEQLKDETGSLARFSNTELFERLFQPHQSEIKDLHMRARALALVYSFSTKLKDELKSELYVLGSLFDFTGKELFQASQCLFERKLVQERDFWRAILPTTIANKLAIEALNYTTESEILKTFSKSGNARLLLSFSYRLSLLHDNEKAQKIVQNWLKPSGILHNIKNLSPNKFKVFENVALVNPKLALENLRNHLYNLKPLNLKAESHAFTTTTFNLLERLSILPECFFQCIQMLLKIAFEDKSPNMSKEALSILHEVFMPKYSENSEKIILKKKIINTLLTNNDERKQILGLELLRMTLLQPSSFKYHTLALGARPQKLGEINAENSLEYGYSNFIQIATSVCNSSKKERSEKCRQFLAKRLPYLLGTLTNSELLIDSILEIHNHQEWIDGWQMIRESIGIAIETNDGIKILNVNQLLSFEKLLRPTELINKIRATVLNSKFEIQRTANQNDLNNFHWPGKSSKCIQGEMLKLGMRFSAESRKFKDLGENLFMKRLDYLLNYFGKGLAIGSKNKEDTWDKLLKLVHTIEK